MATAFADTTPWWLSTCYKFPTAQHRGFQGAFVEVLCLKISLIPQESQLASIGRTYHCFVVKPCWRRSPELAGAIPVIVQKPMSFDHFSISQTCQDPSLAQVTAIETCVSWRSYWHAIAGLFQSNFLCSIISIVTKELFQQGTWGHKASDKSRQGKCLFLRFCSSP